MTAPFLLGCVLALYLVTNAILSRFALPGLTCTRAFSKPAYFEGDEGEMVEVVRNDRPLIIPWLRVESGVSPHIRFGHQENLNVSDHTHTTPKMKFMQGSRYAFLPPMTTIVIEAELGGTLMYYRFPILQKQEGATATVPVNTHVRFQELIIKDLGSPTLYGDKTFENVNFTLVDWTDDSRTGSTENI